MKSSNKLKLSAGEILKAERQAKGLSLVQVEIATRIRGKFLLAIEAGDYQQLPNDIYAYGFVRTYADFLGLDGEDLAKRYIDERGGGLDPSPSTKRLRSLPTMRRGWSPKLLALITTALVVLGVGAYLSWQFTLLAAAPRIQLDSPASDQVIETTQVEVKGQVSAGVEVSVNEVAILTDAGGNFSETITLQEGVNAIRVTARNKLGKSTTITRNILVRPQEEPASEPDPANQ